MADQHPVRRILVGTDPSPGARRALDWAVSLVASFDAELVLVHARGLLEGAAGADHPGWLVDLVDEVATDVPLALAVVDGPPPEALLQAASSFEADLIVVGKRGAGSPFELTMGSTSREVASRATVPVLVVPAG